MTGVEEMSRAAGDGTAYCRKDGINFLLFSDVSFTEIGCSPSLCFMVQKAVKSISDSFEAAIPNAF